MITLQRRQLVGHDILLARHGNHISMMREDRSAGRVVAFLDDGSTDSAPNLMRRACACRKPCAACSVRTGSS